MSINIKEIDSHRNGIGGIPFYVVLFRDSEAVTDTCEGEMVAIIPCDALRQADDGEFHESPCFVLEVNETAKGNIKFAEGNSWRGDRYFPPLRKAIRDWHFKEYGIYPEDDK